MKVAYHHPGRLAIWLGSDFGKGMRNGRHVCYSGQHWTDWRDREMRATERAMHVSMAEYDSYIDWLIAEKDSYVAGLRG